MRKKDKLFCREYLIDLCAKQAALRAGYAPSTAADAWKWIRDDDPTKPEVKAEIDKLMAERSKRTGINADRVLRELGRIAFADVSDVVDAEDGGIKKDASREDTAAVAYVRIRQGRAPEKEVRMHDKVRALELLGRHLGVTDKKAAEDESTGIVAEILRAVEKIE